jgi:NADPH:quinone reductase-like Zn-dependent oxidoreductase
MKAVRYHSYGDSDVLVYEEADRPVAGPGQVVVRVAGAAFTPVDVAIRAGFVHEVFPVDFPHVRTSTWPVSSPRSVRGSAAGAPGTLCWRSCR